MTWQQWLALASARLIVSPSPKRDAEILLGRVTGVALTQLLAFGETSLDDAHCAQLEALLERRTRGEPIAYITGEREFWSLPLLVSTDTLIPRPDTECIVEQALGLLLPYSVKVLDIGTGIGAIALALASERPAWNITGVDCQPGAVAQACENAARLGRKNVQFLCGSWFISLQAAHYHLIVSNLPYIDANDPHLCQGDVRFEPKIALVADDNGLAALSAICRYAGRHLQPGGWLVLEHGWQQGESVRALLARAGFGHITTVSDCKNERVSLGQQVPTLGQAP